MLATIKVEKFFQHLQTFDCKLTLRLQSPHIRRIMRQLRRHLIIEPSPALTVVLAHLLQPLNSVDISSNVILHGVDVILKPSLVLRVGILGRVIFEIIACRRSSLVEKCASWVTYCSNFKVMNSASRICTVPP